MRRGGSALRLCGITLANFRSFSGRIEFPLGRITYIIGPNGAGKSNMLEGVQKIADMMAGGRHAPQPDEYFDDDDDSAMELGATFELSDREQFRLLKHTARLANIDKRDLGPNLPFRFLKYVATPDYETDLKGEIRLSTSGRKLEPFVRATRTGSSVVLACRDIEKSCIKGSPLPPMTTTSHDKPVRIGDLFSLIDPSLLTYIQIMFNGMRVIEIDRSIPATVPVQESHEISPSGRNLPNELNDLPRADQAAFDEIMARATHGDPTGVEPRTAGSDLVLEAHERGLARKTKHTDLGSGQIQTLILGWQTFQRDSSIVVLKEPEMHLHAERQKRLLEMIRQKSSRDDVQFIIETHSPVFLGAGKDETVLLAAKSEGRTSVARVLPENMRLIREELGISHADALYNTRVLFVEGASELAAFPMFWRTLYPDLGFVPSFFSLGGSGNTKHLRLMLEYLRADDRRFFAILDNHDDARAHIKRRECGGLLGDSYRLLPRSFEDEFAGEQIAAAFRAMAAGEGSTPLVDAGALDAARRDGRTAEHLSSLWAEEIGSKFDKVRLAGLLGRLPGGEIPAGIKGALDAAAACFGSNGGGAVRAPAPPARDGKG